MTKKLLQKASNDGITFIFSTKDVDRDGDRVIQDWDLADFRKNPIALAFHQHDQPIGMWENIRVEAGKLMGDLKLAARGTSDFIDTLHGLVEQGILKAVSVGFRSGEAEPNDYGGYDLKKNYLYECSLVSVPANQNALRKAFNYLPEEELDQLCSVSGECSKDLSEGKTTTKRVSDSSTKSKNQKKESTMTVAERIKQLQEKLLAAKDGLTELTQAEEVDNEAIEAASNTIKELEKSLETFEKAEKALAVKTVPVEEKKEPTHVSSVKSVKEKGRLATMAFTAIAKAHALNTTPEAIVKNTYGGDEEVQMMVKAATAPADTTTSTWAAEIVQAGYGEFMDLLMPSTIYGNVPGMSLDFGNKGSVIVPAWNTTRDISGAFVAEGAPIPVKQGVFATKTLTPKKMAVISTFTREIMTKSTPAIEALIRNAIVQDTSLAIDTAFMDNAAASTTRPAGIQNATATGAGNINASAGATVANVLTDVQGVFTRLANVQLGQSGVWLMNPARVFGLKSKQLSTGQFAFPEVYDGMFMGMPIVVSTTVPEAIVAFIDDQAMVKANDIAPEFEASNQATLVMADDADEISTGGAAAAGVTENAVRSLYQTDTMALRFVLGLDWSIYRAGGVQILNTVAW